MKSFSKKSKFGKKTFSRAERRDHSRSKGFSRENRSERKSFSRSDEPASRFDTGFETGAPGRDRGIKPELFQTVCARCGKTAIVPFKPMGNKPVLCKNCFGGKKSFEPREDRFVQRGKQSDRFESRPRPAPSSDTLEQINRKLDRIMRALKIE